MYIYIYSVINPFGAKSFFPESATGEKLDVDYLHKFLSVVKNMLEYKYRKLYYYFFGNRNGRVLFSSRNSFDIIYRRQKTANFGYIRIQIPSCPTTLSKRICVYARNFDIYICQTQYREYKT